MLTKVAPSWEEEIKLRAPSDAALAAVMADDQALAGTALVDRSYVDLYLDLADRTLLTHGLALRLREQGQECWLELKGSGSVAHGMTRRPEWRQKVPEGLPACCQDMPNGAVRDQVLTLVPLQAVLVPLFSCVIRRQTMQLQIPHDGLVEIAFDRGEVRAGQRRAAICEVEVESLSGPGEAALAFANGLAKRHHLALTVRSKFVTGLALLGLEIAGWE